MKYIKSIVEFLKESKDVDWSKLTSKEKRELQYNNAPIKTNIDYSSLIDEIMEIHSGDWQINFEDEDDARDYLDTVLNYDLKILPQKVKLYRVLVAESSEKISKSDLGRHFVEDKRLLRDTEFLESIGIDEINFNKLWSIEVLVNKSDIDVKQTAIHRLLNPEEYEIYMKNGFTPLDIKIEKVNI